MQTNMITELIENFAPLESQEGWDCSGWVINFDKDVKKIMLCLSVTDKIIEQALKKNCDLVISHHPLFSVPLSFNKNIPIYCAHTNLDKAQGGTTDTLIGGLGMVPEKKSDDFLRFVEFEGEVSLHDFIGLIKSRLGLKNLRVVNNSNKQMIKKIAFCAGSGTDFLSKVQENNADIFVTGDVKYHCALESNVIIIDVGHFESERPVLEKIEKMLNTLNLEVIIADEKSPFINY